jgi:acetate kinase
MGICIDHEKNAAMKPGRATDTDLTGEGSRVKILVIPTNEEIAIARDTLELVTK